MTDPVRTIRAGRVLTPGGFLGPAELTFTGGRITSIRPVVTAPDTVLCAGFIDLQVNGWNDVDVAVADPEGLRRISASLTGTGVTAWCPTLVSAPLDRYPERLAAIEAAAAADPVESGDGRRPGAVVLGAHLEGPALAVAGAHDPTMLTVPDRRWWDTLGPAVRLVTLAPELDGAPEVIVSMASRGVVVSLGHSRADEATTVAAIDSGARMVTHFGNAMAPLAHRSPTLANVALDDPRVTVAVIADAVHLAPSFVRLVHRAVGPGRMILVSDAIATVSGQFAGRPLRLVDGVPRLSDGTLAGSTLQMDTAVRNVVTWGIPLQAALLMASASPAALLGDPDRGRLERGRRADLVLLDDRLEVIGTWVVGVAA